MSEELFVCPFCEKENSLEIINSWTYAKHDVDRYHCKNCDEKFNLHKMESGLRYMIPKVKEFS